MILTRVLVLDTNTKFKELKNKYSEEKLAEIAKIGNVDTTDAEENLYTYKQRISELTNELVFYYVDIVSA